MLGSDVDVVVELIGGLDPAGEWVRRALDAGKSVVTANKKLIAYHGVELENLVRSKGAALLYGAAVEGSIPVITSLWAAIRSFRAYGRGWLGTASRASREF